MATTKHKYKDFRKNIQSGDLLAWTHKGWNSWYNFQIQMVRAFCQSEYAHNGIAFVTGGRVFVLEAVVPDVRIYPLSKCESFYCIGMHKKLSKKAEEYALSQVGGKYSKWMCFKAFFGIVKGGDSGKWQCAKYANEVLKANGIDYGNAFTPSTLVQAALADGKELLYLITQEKA